MKNFRRCLLTVLTMVIMIGASACNPAVATPAATIAPTATTLPTPSPAPTIQPEDSTRELEVNESKRTYQLHIPPGLAQGHPIPVVFVFHGYTYSVSFTRSQSYFDEIADANGFITVYPVGTGASWNAGDCCGLAVEKGVDEIAYVRQILSDLETIVSIDPKRIYAAGFSNGAMLSYRLACEMSDTFAAVAPVSGPLFLNNCQPPQPVSIIHIHGLNDPYVPYTGGQPVEFDVPEMPPVEAGIEAWVELNDCADSPQVEVEGVITRTIYACQAGTAIELYTLDGLEHSWPRPTGSGELNFPATQTIWEFFAAHPKP